MRIGRNPQRDTAWSIENFTHQIIIPVYIPNFTDYFKDSFEIFKLCIKSLLKTTHSNTFITIVNNGSNDQVVKYLSQLYLENKIHELIHTTNIGKTNAILKALKGHYFEYITVSDADVLFLNGWQEETMKVFHSFSKAGVVGLIPQFRLFGDMSYNVLYDNFWSKKLKFTSVKNVAALKEYYRSLGWENNYNPDYLKYILTLSSKNNNNFKVVVGSGHVVATYRKNTLEHNPKVQINELLSPKFDRALLDAPTLKVGGWRLTTENNHAYHMGNVYEDWMLTVFNETKVESTQANVYSNHEVLKTTFISYFVKNHLFRKLIKYKIIQKWFLMSKGLPENVAKKF